ncbi:hypothetical protein BDW68DRAFT_157981 [Aspergillus falconensis]
MSLLSMTRGMTQHLHCFLDLIVYGANLHHLMLTLILSFLPLHFCFSASFCCISIYYMEVECWVLSIF